MHDTERHALAEIARALQVLAEGGSSTTRENVAFAPSQEYGFVRVDAPKSEIERELSRMDRALHELATVTSSLWKRADLVVLPTTPTTGGCDEVGVEPANSPAGSSIQAMALRAAGIAAELRNFCNSLATSTPS